MIEVRSQNLSGTDFTQGNFENGIVTHCNLTNCILPANCKATNFGGAYGTNVDFSKNKSDLTGASFYLCKSLKGFLMEGALWAGEVLTKSPYTFTDRYWCMGTAKNLQVGCTIYTMEQALAFTEADLRKLDPRNVDLPVAWWAANKERVIALAAIYASPPEIPVVEE